MKHVSYCALCACVGLIFYSVLLCRSCWSF